MSKKTIKETNQEIRKERRRQSAEDFTPSFLVNQILDKMSEYASDILTDPEKTIIDPACGNANMLIEVLKRKLLHMSPTQAISTIYGCDIFENNITECRLRLLKVIDMHSNQKPSKEELIEIVKWLYKNIVHVNTEEHPNGSLDYLQLTEEKTFNHNITDEMSIEIINNIQENNLLDSVEI